MPLQANTKFMLLMKLLIEGHAVSIYGSLNKIAMDSDRNVSYIVEKEEETYFLEEKLSIPQLYSIASNLPDCVIHALAKKKEE